MTAIPLAVFVIDQLTKRFFRSIDALRASPHRLLPNIVDITHHENFGLIADLAVPRALIIGFTTVVIGLIVWRIVVNVRNGRLHLAYPLALVTGGALGNLWDRMAYGFVFDWLLLFNRSIINVADAAIAVGIVWYVIEKGRDQE